MAGIDADANAGFVFNAVNDGGKMLKFKTEVTALTGGIFDNRGHAFGFASAMLMDSAIRAAFIFRDLLQVAARMEVEQR